MQHTITHLVARAAAEDRQRAQRHPRDVRDHRHRPRARAHAARALAVTAKRLDHHVARRSVA